MNNNNENDYCIKCNVCGEHFDARDLNEVIRHEHIDEKMNIVSHFISQKKGEEKQWINGNEEIDLN